MHELISVSLNLEHMPKDESLLNILRQLLDTITFFRIQEIKKSQIEKKYKQKHLISSNFGLNYNFKVIYTTFTKTKCFFSRLVVDYFSPDNQAKRFF